MLHGTVSYTNYFRRQKHRSSHLSRDQFNWLFLVTPEHGKTLQQEDLTRS